MTKPTWNFEAEPRSEAGINLCAYFVAMPDAKFESSDPAMIRCELMRWERNFKSDGDVLLPCARYHHPMRDWLMAKT